MVLNLYEKLHQSSIYIFLGGKKSTLLQEKLKCSISFPPKIEIEALYKIINMLSKKFKRKKKEKKITNLKSLIVWSKGSPHRKIRELFKST